MSVAIQKHSNSDSFPQIAAQEIVSRYKREIDPPILQIAAYIPIVGALVSDRQKPFLIQEFRLIENQTSKEEAIEWISAVSQYTATNAVRNMIGAALSAAGIAISLFSSSYLSLGLSAIGFCTAMNTAEKSLNDFQFNKENLIRLKEDTPIQVVFIDNNQYRLNIQN